MPPDQDFDVEEMEDVSTTQDEAEVSKTPAKLDSSARPDVSNMVADDDALSIVREVVDGRASEEAEASSAASEEVAGAKDAGGQGPDDDFADAPFNKHPRFKQLLSQRNEFKRDAENYRNVQSFIDHHGLQAEEAAEALVVGGLLKTNPIEAWNRLKPVVQQLLIATGEVLPDDLADMVRSGAMTHDAALVTSRTRAENAVVRNGLGLREQRELASKQRDVENGQRQASERLMQVAQDWEDDRRAKDPNFDAKQPAIIAEVRRLRELGYTPTTTEGVQDQLKRAYASVNARLQPRSVSAPRPAVTPVRGGQVNGSARPAPQSTLEIIRRTVEARAS